MSDIDKPLPNESHQATLTIRMIMNGKEVGSIIGKGGEIINSIREDSGAKIHITDGSVPERIVTVTGHTDAILRAFSLICRKFEDDGGGSSSSAASTSSGSSAGSRPPITLRLIVPASQCGSLIGKGGSKIKEIREVTCASIQVASEMLPNSTERTVTVSGTREAIKQCIYHVCVVMLESPAKGTTIPYSPKSGVSGAGGLGGLVRNGTVSDNPIANLLGLGGLGGAIGGGLGGGVGGASTLAALASLAGSQIRDRGGDRSGGRDRERSDRGGATQTYEVSTTIQAVVVSCFANPNFPSFQMSIPNDMIGCIIGKGGSKIAEIRQISGAMIRISKSDEIEGNAERQISISGHADSVALAKSLINMSLDIHKAKLEDKDGARDNRERRYGGGSGSGPGSAGAELGGLAQLLAKPEALTALTTLATFGGLGAGLFGSLGSGHGGNSHGAGSHSGGGPGHVTGVHRSRGSYGGGSRGSRDDSDRGASGRESKRSKFAPY